MQLIDRRAARLAPCTVALLIGLTGLAEAHVGLDAPNGGEKFPCGTMQTIAWHIQVSHGTQNWDLWYSTTGSSGPWIPIALDLPKGDISSGAKHTYQWLVPHDLSTNVRVRVRQDNSGTDYEDISDGDLTILDQVSTDLGFGKAGGGGVVPELTACGDLATGGVGGTLDLQNGPPTAAVLVVASLQMNPTPFSGGTLVPVPVKAVVPLVTDGNGAFTVPLTAGTWGAVDLYVQCAIDDPTATFGVSLSNAVKLSWP